MPFMILYACTIFVSDFLLFLIQPIIAKQILPWFGGSAAVWTTCLVFFQCALLAGYQSVRPLSGAASWNKSAGAGSRSAGLAMARGAYTRCGAMAKVTLRDQVRGGH